MSEMIDDGGPAFPTKRLINKDEDGMCLRDYFAVHACEEDVKAQAEVIRARMIRQNGVAILPDDWQCAARYMHADAMLKARKP